MKRGLIIMAAALIAAFSFTAAFASASTPVNTDIQSNSFMSFNYNVQSIENGYSVSGDAGWKTTSGFAEKIYPNDFSVDLEFVSYTGDVQWYGFIFGIGSSPFITSSGTISLLLYKYGDTLSARILNNDMSILSMVNIDITNKSKIPISCKINTEDKSVTFTIAETDLTCNDTSINYIALARGCYLTFSVNYAKEGGTFSVKLTNFNLGSQISGLGKAVAGAFISMDDERIASLTNGAFKLSEPGEEKSGCSGMVKNTTNAVFLLCFVLSVLITRKRGKQA